MAAGRFTWNELMTPDVAAAKTFYGAVLGWTYAEHPMPDGVYTLALAPGGGEPVAGLFPWPADRPGANDWFAYIEVDDIAAAVAGVAAAGGKVLRAPWPIEGVGMIAIVADSVGAGFGLMQPAGG